MKESLMEKSVTFRDLIKERGLPVPKNLTDIDTFLVSKQCILQKDATGDKQLIGFANAYSEAKDFALNKENLDSLTAEKIEDLVLDWGEMIEEQNKTGYRTTPVYFADFSHAVDASLVPGSLQTIYKLFLEGFMDPVEFYTQFEKIHPFKDGNGRVGDLLWKLAVTKTTGKWPDDVPPDVFAKKE